MTASATILSGAEVGAVRALDCQSCGACCAEAGAVGVYYGTREAPSDVEETTPRHLTRSVRKRMGFASYEADVGTRCMKTDLGGRCVALLGEIGGSVCCRIYDRRPAVCREFKPGSDGCLASRERMAWKLRNMDRKPHGYGPAYALPDRTGSGIEGEA